jgi:nucleolar GTP-binding protein
MAPRSRPGHRRRPPRPRPRRGPRKGREDRGASRGGGGRAAPSSVILDIAFRRAYRATPHGSDPLDRSRRRALLKIVRSTAVAQRQLRLALKRFPREGLGPLRERLVVDRFGPGSFDRAVARVRRAGDRIRDLSRDEQLRLRQASSEEGFGESVRRTYGRLASFLLEVDPDLRRLMEIDRYLDERPSLVAGTPTLVVAGFPNVGKSSLVGRLTSAQPKVADYPFTTLAIGVGHVELGFERMQVVDTPGVLGRKGKSNPAELEAVAAVERAGDAILFVLDPTEECGHSMAEQEALLARWKREYPNVPMLEIATKADRPHAPTGRLEVSATTGQGLEELRERIRAALARPAPPIPEGEPSATE